MAGMAGNDWKWLDLDKTWLKMADKVEAGSRLKFMIQDNQIGLPYHSFDCVL